MLLDTAAVQGRTSSRRPSAGVLLGLRLCQLLPLLTSVDVWLWLVSATGQWPLSTDPPIRAEPTPLLLRALLLAVAAALGRLALLSLASTRPPLRALQTAATPLLALTAAVHCSALLLSTLHPLQSLLPSLTLALHAALVCTSATPQLSTASPLLPSLRSLPSVAWLPLSCAWLSCYLLVLDWDDAWQVFPLPQLLALHSAAAAIEGWRALSRGRGLTEAGEDAEEGQRES